MCLETCCKLLFHWESADIAQTSAGVAHETLPEATEDWAASKVSQEEQAVLSFPFVTCSTVSVGISRACFPTAAPQDGFQT